MNSLERIYLDYHSTTPVDPAALEEMLPYFREHFGNPAAKQHYWGWTAEAAVELARERVSQLLGAQTPREVIFTSSATEASHWMIHGAVERLGAAQGLPLVITSSIEHKSVSETCKRLAKQGRIEWKTLPVDRHGVVQVGVLEQWLAEPGVAARTALVSVIAASHEVGTLQPVKEISIICRKKGVLFHTDAVQAVGKIHLNVQELGVDALTVSAHKMYGPKGIGALYLRRSQPRVEIEPLFVGGGQERGMRSGTLNVPAIVGFGKAAEIARLGMAAENERLIGLRTLLWSELRKAVPGIALNGHPEARLPHNLSVQIPGVPGDALMMQAKELGLSSGSACNSENPEPSSVLMALGLSEAQARSTLRIGLGRWTTEQEVCTAAEKIGRIVRSTEIR